MTAEVDGGGGDVGVTELGADLFEGDAVVKGVEGGGVAQGVNVIGG